ncbi:MAG: cbb3-type cytochrome oxidase assembly protein CcoS [Burkholderiales bacterium]|jgi:cbb3-type cytochrome oxidase maturation protein|nr:cbb3-type cytochrome oxidase assembly protein CcoS [Burkholderiales bacterium]
MEILWLLIPVSVLLVLVMGCVFWWGVRSGQFDDLDGPAYRILADDDNPAPEIASGEGSGAEKGRKEG